MRVIRRLTLRIEDFEIPQGEITDLFMMVYHPRDTQAVRYPIPSIKSEEFPIASDRVGEALGIMRYQAAKQCLGCYVRTDVMAIIGQKEIRVATVTCEEVPLSE